MIRVFIYAMLLSAAIFAALYSTAGKERGAAELRRNCAEQPTEKCLAQAASALGTRAVNDYYVGVVVERLMRMGYIEEAQSLSRRSEMPKPIEVEQQFSRGYFALSAALQKKQCGFSNRRDAKIHDAKRRECIGFNNIPRGA